VRKEYLLFQPPDMQWDHQDLQGSMRILQFGTKPKFFSLAYSKFTAVQVLESTAAIPTIIGFDMFTDQVRMDCQTYVIPLVTLVQTNTHTHGYVHMPMQATGVNLCTKYVGPLHDPGVPTRPTVKLVSCPLDILRSQTAMKKPMIAFMFMRKKHQQLMMGAYFFVFQSGALFLAICYILKQKPVLC
jgi:hypothetical protein